MGNPESIVPLDSVVVKGNLTYKEVPVEILDCQVQRLRNKEVASVKVLGRIQSLEEVTWEVETSSILIYVFSMSFQLDVIVSL